ncbi:kinesin-related protein 10-like isoform X1 [Microplitis mediator]|uniref:kinesin-related protein 10-like isoform X1 n=1 Tax=Microplitis mediator TaxID=375433 RepID=UPI002553A55A|nr:kinesin-related protein 10-like isoform X1 [Microplitis mediator]
MNRRTSDSSKSSVKNARCCANEVIKAKNTPNLPKSSSSGVVVLDNETTTVEVTVKKRGKKSSSNVDKVTVSNEKLSGDKKQSCGFENHHWSRILREQNLSTLKQNYRPCLAKSQQESKTIQRQRSSENIYERDTKKLTSQRNSSRHNNNNNNNNDLIDNISSKQITPKKLNHDNRYSYSGGMPSVTSTNSNTESVFVVDRGVQCGGIYDGTNDNFRKLNPVRTLAFLMKELEIIIGGGRAGEILTEMEDALLRIPVESGQPSHMDLETIAAKAKLEANIAKLESTCKTMEEGYKSVRKENTILQQRIQELSGLLKQTKQQESELECEIKRLRTDLNEALKNDLANRKLINELREENRQIGVLKKELKDEMELTHYLKLEKEKLTIMSSYKDAEFIKLRNAIKELQNNIADQLVGLREFPTDNGVIFPDHHSTMIAGKTVCSTPSPTLHKSPEAQVWRNRSDLSDSTINPRDSNAPATHQQIPLSNTNNDTNNDKFQEKTHLEFISLAGEESLHSSSKSNHDLKSIDEVDTSKNNNESQDKRKKINSKLNKVISKNKSKLRGDSKLQSNNDNGYHDSNIYSVNFIDKDMEKEIKMMYENMRQKIRIPVNVPSPPRNFPNPDWSDSTLPTMSISESTSA